VGQSPSEANSRPASQEILPLMWNSDVHYCVQKSPPSEHVPNQFNRIHTPPLPYFHNIGFNIMLSAPRPSECCGPFRFSNRNFVGISHLYRVCCMPCPFHPRFHYPDNVWCCVHFIYPPPPQKITSCVLGQIFTSAPFSRGCEINTNNHFRQAKETKCYCYTVRPRRYWLTGAGLPPALQ
jgi:hypothetical protein